MNTSLVALTSISLLSGLAAFAGDPPADPRPGELSTIMAGLAVDMERIQAGMWTGDLSEVSRAAGAIAHHPKADEPERKRVMGVMGPDMPLFKAADDVVHESAARLSEVAARGDMDASLAELATLQAGCVACHTAFRERLRR